MEPRARTLFSFLMAGKARATNQQTERDIRCPHVQWNITDKERQDNNFLRSLIMTVQ